MTDEMTYTDEMIRDIAAFLPPYPPLKPGGDCSVRDLRPDLSDRDLDRVYAEYIQLGGTMEKE